MTTPTFLKQNFHNISLTIFLQLYKGEVFMTCFMTWYFDETLVSLIVQHWLQTMLILYQVIETWLKDPKESMLDPKESCKTNLVP